MRYTLLLSFLGTASPLFAASGPFFSLKNTDFVVLLSFLLFVAILLYFKVPKLLGGMLDKRSAGIQVEIDEESSILPPVTAPKLIKTHQNSAQRSACTVSRLTSRRQVQPAFIQEWHIV